MKLCGASTFQQSYMRLACDMNIKYEQEKAKEVQGAQHRLHSTSWYKDVKKLEDIVNRKKDAFVWNLDNGIFLIETFYKIWTEYSIVSQDLDYYYYFNLFLNIVKFLKFFGTLITIVKVFEMCYHIIGIKEEIKIMNEKLTEKIETLGKETRP
ncbi:unnamed protein product [Rhizophagus irregularis]|nr:unnamed protein product [Rhizophagus irregularis]